MTPEEDKELDQWLDGLAGKAEAQAGTGFDELDARLVHDLRELDRQWQEEVTDLDVARAWSKVKPLVGSARGARIDNIAAAADHSRRNVAFPFASGIAAGALLALGSTLVFQTLRQVEPDLGYKSPDTSLPAEATWSVGLISSDPTATIMELEKLLEGLGLAFTVGFDSGVYTVEWRHAGVNRDSKLVKWLNGENIGIFVPDGTEHVVLTVRPRSPE